MSRGRAMRICLLTNQDLDAEVFPADDWPCDPRPFLPQAEWDVVTLKYATSVTQVKKCLAAGYDLYFNLCDGAEDQDVPGIEVVRTLEEAGVLDGTRLSLTPAGVNATRFSLFFISFGTPIIIIELF